MAEPLPFPELVSELKRALGAESTRDLARKLGFEQGDPERKVYRWFTAKRGSYEATLLVLDRMGFLTEEARVFLNLGGPRGSAAGLGDRLEAAEAAAAQAKEVVRRGRGGSRRAAG